MAAFNVSVQEVAVRLMRERGVLRLTPGDTLMTEVYNEWARINDRPVLPPQEASRRVSQALKLSRNFRPMPTTGGGFLSHDRKIVSYLLIAPP